MKTHSGISLLEVIISIGVSVVLIAGLVLAVTTSIRNSQFAKNQTLATKFSQEAMEWIRSQRDAAVWSIFYARASAAGNRYCLITILSWPSPSACGATGFITGTSFKREANLKTIDANKIQVTVTVLWTDPMGTHQSQLTSYFSNQNLWR